MILIIVMTRWLATASGLSFSLREITLCVIVNTRQVWNGLAGSVGDFRSLEPIIAGSKPFRVPPCLRRAGAQDTNFWALANTRPPNHPISSTALCKPLEGPRKHPSGISTAKAPRKPLPEASGGR
jgi:hypothetical protein